jgi:isoleucyl-tRNA synthetase
MSHRTNWRAHAAPPLRAGLAAITFDVPLIDGDHVTDDAGTGFVHTAPGHGREDFDIWMETPRTWKRAASTPPFPSPSTMTVSTPKTRRAPGRTAKAARRASSTTRARRATPTRRHRGADRADRLFARGRLKHTYPHSWRSKKPVIFRNTPQWFVHMDKDLGDRATRCAPARSTPSTKPASCRRPARTACADDRGPARLGALASACLGRADLRLRRQGG